MRFISVVASHCGHNISAHGHHANTMIWRISNVDVPWSVYSDTSWITQSSRYRWSSISTVSRYPITSHSSDDTSAVHHHTNATLFSDVRISIRIESDAGGKIQFSWFRLLSICYIVRRPITSNSTDDTSAFRHHTDAIILSINEVYITWCVSKHTGGTVQLSRCRWSSITTVTTVFIDPSTSHSADDTSTLRNYSNTVVTPLANVDVPWCIHKDTHWRIQFTWCRWSSISTVTICPITSHSSDDTSALHHQTDAIIIRISYVDIARFIYEDTSRIIESSWCRWSAISTLLTRVWRYATSHSADDTSALHHHANATVRRISNVDVPWSIYSDTARIF